MPRTHWDMLRERRSIEELEELLKERLEIYQVTPPRQLACYERYPPTSSRARGAKPSGIRCFTTRFRCRICIRLRLPWPYFGPTFTNAGRS